jgi:hypothetical protein
LFAAALRPAAFFTPWLWATQRAHPGRGGDRELFWECGSEQRGSGGKDLLHGNGEVQSSQEPEQRRDIDPLEEGDERDNAT